MRRRRRIRRVSTTVPRNTCCSRAAPASKPRRFIPHRRCPASKARSPKRDRRGVEPFGSVRCRRLRETPFERFGAYATVPFGADLIHRTNHRGSLDAAARIRAGSPWPTALDAVAAAVVIAIRVRDTDQRACAALFGGDLALFGNHPGHSRIEQALRSIAARAYI